jgi:hypothetical protein
VVVPSGFVVGAGLVSVVVVIVCSLVLVDGVRAGAGFAGAVTVALLPPSLMKANTSLAVSHCTRKALREVDLIPVFPPPVGSSSKFEFPVIFTMSATRPT